MANSSINIAPKKYVRSIISASTYLITKMAFYLAPNKAARLMRKKGFSVKPYHLNAKQRALQQQAHGFYLEFNQNKIKVFEWGAGPVVLLVHGWGGRALQLDAFVHSLVEKGFKVVAFDHKGHGDSSSNFSSYLEIVRSTDLLLAHYAQDLFGLIAHSIGSNAAFKISEKFERNLKIAVVAPLENFPRLLERMRRRIGIYEKLFANVIVQIETDTGLNLLEQCNLNLEKISRHEVLLVHDKFDRINKISASYHIHSKLPGSSLMETEMLGHSRILTNHDVVRRVVAHFSSNPP